MFSEGALCSSLRNIVKHGILIFGMYKKVIIQTSKQYFENINFIDIWVNKLFLRENKVARANINYKTVWNVMSVCLFIYLINKTESLFSSFRHKKSVSEDLSPLIKISSQRLRSAPLKKIHTFILYPSISSTSENKIMLLQ